MSSDVVERTVQGLDPIARGVLDLSLRHDFSDSSIARVIGRSDHQIAQLREETMGRVADELGISGPDAHERTREALLSVAPELWIGAPRRPAEPEPEEPEVEPEPEPEKPEEPEPDPEEPDPEPEEEPEAEPEPEPEPEAEQQPAPGVGPASVDDGPQRSGGLILLALALVGALVVVLFLADSGDEPADRTVAEQTAPDPPDGADEPEPDPAPPPPEESNSDPAPPTAPTTTSGELAPLPGSPAAGSAVVSILGQDGERSVTVDLEGLRDPRGVYELWLFTSLIESQPLGATDSGDGEITAALPPDAESYASLDLSLEESADDPLHSGRSVRRAPLAQVLETGG